MGPQNNAYLSFDENVSLQSDISIVGLAYAGIDQNVSLQTDLGLVSTANTSSEEFVESRPLGSEEDIIHSNN